ncbi:hypothetical protein ACQEVZ_45810 [Dactylosporangium sp. CA-152071]|uniref:hypothetical protein n=1 Tax=Dactylosporangium sp. CA-152071 TaxID=3239933 RepID=UPI003D8EE8F8
MAANTDPTPDPTTSPTGAPTGVNLGYAVDQLARALVTATTHEDADTRRRADRRMERWGAVLRGVLDGKLTIGSRTPVKDLPAWVTPGVVRGGFATGSAAAEGPLLPHEQALATRMRVAADRAELFRHHLGKHGLTDLWTLLDTGAYRVDLPEEAALLTVAWLVRAGDDEAASAVVEEIAPFAGRLRFAPQPADSAPDDPSIVWRHSAGEVREELAARRPNPRIEAMREALTVWNPFADELLTHWLATVVDGRVAERADEAWTARSRTLLARYTALADRHRHCTKHRNRKQNLAILRNALAEHLTRQGLDPRTRGLLQHAVDSMVRRRGAPGSPAHTALRAEQAAIGAVPTHHGIARVVVARLAALPQDVGVSDVDAVLRPVEAGEAPDAAIPVGTAVPDAFGTAVRRAAAGTVEELLDAGVVPSAEVLAMLVPQLAAASTAAAYRDPALQQLMTATYRAFRNRRSLLLLNLEHQVRLEELPWVRAVQAHRHADADTRGAAAGALRRLGELTLDAFPATVLPNPLVRELSALGAETGLRLPWVEELAADIFMGTFSGKYLAAAQIAGGLLTGSLYERYYGIDYAALTAVDDVRNGRYGARTSPTFDALCGERARASGSTGSGSVAANGTVIEQAQILTTHNLATLVGPAGVRPAGDWATLAWRAYVKAKTLAAQVPASPHPLPVVKDIAYAWRHLVFYLSMPGADPAEFVRTVRSDADGLPFHVQIRLQPAIGGLEHVVTGGTFPPDGTAAPDRRRLLGWSTRGHWMLPSRSA